MYLAGDSVSRIELTFFGMRIDKRSTTKLSYRKDILVALGGIIFNFLFATVCLSAYHIIGSADLLMLAIINIIIAAVNSFPTSSLDAGKALKYFMLLHLSKERAELLSERISDAFCVVFTVSTVLYYCFYGVNISLIAVNLYLITITILKKRR